MSSSILSTVEEAISDLEQGKMIILIDDEDRENEGDLVIAADQVTPEAINFMATHGRGLICLSLTEKKVEALELPMMTKKNKSPYGTAFTVSIEAAKGVTTGISAADRARTIQVAVAPHSQPADLVTPGHIFPLKAKNGGVLVRAGQTEGSVDLARLAGLTPAGVICEVMSEDGTMARLPELQVFAKKHDLKIVSTNDLIAYRLKNEQLVQEVAATQLPTEAGDGFELKVFQNTIDSIEHVVLMTPNIDFTKPVLVRAHSECLTGDVFGSSRCDCGWQLQASLKKISEEGGILLYMRQHEGRGIGLVNKIKAYAYQDQGLDTVEANHKLGFQEDHRDYGVGSQILRSLGIRQMKILTNNPKKIYGLKGYGLEIVERVPIEMTPNQSNEHYLRTKKDKLGHLLNLV